MKYMTETTRGSEPERVTYARQLAEKLRFECQVFFHEATGKTTQDAERATGLDSDHIIKCLLLKSKDNHYVGAIIRGSDRLNFKEVEALTGYKSLRMAQETDVQRELGFDLGGVPAVIFKERRIPTYVDQQVLTMSYVVGSGGTPHHGMRFEPSQLTDKLSYILTKIAVTGNNGKLKHT